MNGQLLPPLQVTKDDKVLRIMLDDGLQELAL
jgi:hypothetical protein